MPITGGSGAHCRGIRCPLYGVQVHIKGGSGAYHLAGPTVHHDAAHPLVLVEVRSATEIVAVVVVVDVKSAAEVVVTVIEGLAGVARLVITRTLNEEGGCRGYTGSRESKGRREEEEAGGGRREEGGGRREGGGGRRLVS